MAKYPGPQARPANDHLDAIDPGQAAAAPTPDVLIRTFDGRITSWSAGMQRRYGFAEADALGQTAHQLLRTAFPSGLPNIAATLEAQHSWSGALVHRHADGHPVIAVNHWLLSCGTGQRSRRVTEVHFDIHPASDATCEQIADVLMALTHEITEPLTAILNYVVGARRTLRQGAPDLASLREVMTLAFEQVERGAAWVHTLRELAMAMRKPE